MACRNLAEYEPLSCKGRKKNEKYSTFYILKQYFSIQTVTSPFHRLKTTLFSFTGCDIAYHEGSHGHKCSDILLKSYSVMWEGGCRLG